MTVCVKSHKKVEPKEVYTPVYNLLSSTSSKAEFIARVGMQGDRYVIFVPKRYVSEEIKKLRKSPSIKVIVHDEL
jgi:hypothetical protein